MTQPVSLRPPHQTMSEQKSRQQMAVLLAQVPEALRPFFQDIFRELPSGFVVTPKGIAFQRRSDDAPEPFCTPYRVKAQSRKGAKSWSLVIEILDPLGNLVDCVLPYKMLEGRPREALGLLAEHGWRLRDAAVGDAALNIIRQWPEKAFLSELDRSGWTPDRSAFALPTGEILTREGAPEAFRYTGSGQAKALGDLATWQAGVAALCPGNPNLLFACSTAFSAPLLAFLPTGGTTIYHFHEKTSRGKTVLLRAAATIWPRTGKGDTVWSATINGLEAEIARANDLLFTLDEVPEEPDPSFADMIYLVGNGTGKGRALKDGTSAGRQTWKAAVLSAGEAPMLDVLKRIGRTPRGGQGVRMIDVPAVGVYGAFDALHSHATSDDFVGTLENAIGEVAGPPGTAFVLRLIQAETEQIEMRLKADLKAEATALQTCLGIVAGDPATTEIRRVLNAFALVSVAGEWASEFGITGWEPGAASAAVRQVARRWLDGRGSASLDDSVAVEKTRDFLLQNESRFVEIPLKRSQKQDTSTLLGFRDAEYLYLLSSTMARIGSTPRTLARNLREAGYLVPGDADGPSLQVRMSELVGGKRPHVYRVRRAILEA
ncbi:putative DNA primase/helicase [[Luteovulum] sphaeroides subsp. megalophilum]|uniref:DUF927 domain-containing protein n=1 Tax=Cereibacter sphaeroides TaxID=1063 RepID=UPI000B6B6C58|nr:DUF927 domain-containing protein [Cereibacter sphaeroides]SNT42259.1 putative DNA primase/helicase [[Luteovulum] sphaeroides subsp. megalophilum]